MLEVCVDHIKSVIAADKGGADRIELCSALSEGGLTPTTGFLKSAKKITKMKIFPMLRPSPGGFIYSDEEKLIILSDLEDLKAAGADGFVFGALTYENRIDEELCSEVVNKASPLPVTFHRAFDFTNPENIIENIEILIRLQFKRVLTSGFHSSAILGIDNIEKLSKYNSKIIVLPGAGINVDNIETIIKRTGCREIHASARNDVSQRMSNPRIKLNESGKLLITDTGIVMQLKNIINKF